MTHYTLVIPDGESLGAAELLGQGWRAGMTIYRGGDGVPNLRVVDVLEADDPEVFGILVVEET